MVMQISGVGHQEVQVPSGTSGANESNKEVQEFKVFITEQMVIRKCRESSSDTESEVQNPESGEHLGPSLNRSIRKYRIRNGRVQESRSGSQVENITGQVVQMDHQEVQRSSVDLTGQWNV
jgi:hypothetical protein